MDIFSERERPSRWHNRLMASDNFGLTAQYTYDASGERVIKSSAENQKTIFINGAPAGYTYHNENYTAYVGGHFEVKEGRFTKHYFNGAERLASKIGVGTLDNSAAKGYYQAGGIDYGKRYADAYKDFKQIAKEQGLPPGPPNLKFIYAQQALADERANQETVSDLSLLNNLSLAEWEQQNTDKDPGPPICDDVFCGTGGNIDTGSLPENDIYFFHPDHLGSTSYITNISGETVQFNSYLPFGETFVSQRRTTTISAYLFNGKEQDPETGLYYYGARYYNSSISTWLSVDPLWEETMAPYNYTYQNPIKYIDPTGMIPEPEEAGVLANDVYTASKNNIGKEVPNSGGFTLDKINTDTDNPGYKSAVYSRETKEGDREYVMANMGTLPNVFTPEGRDSVSEDLEQPFGGSEHMDISLQDARNLVEKAGNSEVTFVGHSKGGSEAAGNALKFNKSAILFNPAALNAKAYGLDVGSYSGSMTAYIVNGDPVAKLNWLLGAKPIDSRINLPRQSYLNPIKNHSNYNEALRQYNNPTTKAPRKSVYQAKCSACR